MRTLAALAMSAVAWQLEDSGNNWSFITAMEMVEQRLIIPGQAKDLQDRLSQILEGRELRIKILMDAWEEVRLWKEFLDLYRKKKNDLDTVDDMGVLVRKALDMRLGREWDLDSFGDLFRKGWVRRTDWEALGAVLRRFNFDE